VAEPALGAPLTRAHDALECDAVARLLDHLAVAVAHEPFDPSPNPEGLAAEREHLDVEQRPRSCPIATNDVGTFSAPSAFLQRHLNPAGVKWLSPVDE
jgi:hypothetical protein